MQDIKYPEEEMTIPENGVASNDNGLEIAARMIMLLKAATAQPQYCPESWI
jgi:hypothetical protein